MDTRIFLKSEKGYFGEGDFKFGGCFIPEILYPALSDLQKAYKQIFQTKGFQKELKRLLKTFVGRPTPLIYAKNASEILGNEIYLKFEGLANTGAHKVNNALAQVLLAKRMKKTHIIAETGAGQHGVAVASVCAFLKMPCTIFMGATDMQRQRPNVFIMEQFGAEVIAVDSGTKTLKDAVNEALRQWSKVPNEYFYVLGSALGPYPYPDIVRDSQSIIGKEIKKQIKKALGSYLNTFLPDYVVACVGGGSNSIGTFSAFLEDMEVKLVGVEAGGEDFKPNKHAMRLTENSGASIGIAHGYLSYFLQDKHGQISNTHSISAGLDYAGVGPQLAHLKHIGRVEFIAASDDSALDALKFFARHEGILPALESSHALAGALEIAKKEKNKTIVVNVSGRGDKDIFITAKALCAKEWRDFLESELQSVEKLLKHKNNLRESTIKEEGDEYLLNRSQNELKLALQGIRDEDMSLFDSMDTKNEDIKKHETHADTHIYSKLPQEQQEVFNITSNEDKKQLDIKDLDCISKDIQSLEKLDSNCYMKGENSINQIDFNETNMDSKSDSLLIDKNEVFNSNNKSLESDSIGAVNNIENNETKLTQNIQNDEQEIANENSTKQENHNHIQANNSEDSIESVENTTCLANMDSLNTNTDEVEYISREPLHFLAAINTESNLETSPIKDSIQKEKQIFHFLQDNDLQNNDNLQEENISISEGDLQVFDKQVDVKQELIINNEISQETNQISNMENNEMNIIEKEVLQKNIEINTQNSMQIESDNADPLLDADSNTSLETLLNKESSDSKTKEQNGIDLNERLAEQLLDLQTIHESSPETLEDLRHLAQQYQQEGFINELSQDLREIQPINESLLEDIESHTNHKTFNNIESNVIDEMQNIESFILDANDTINNNTDNTLDIDTNSRTQDEKLDLNGNTQAEQSRNIVENMALNDMQQNIDEKHVEVNTFDETIDLKNIDSKIQDSIFEDITTDILESSLDYTQTIQDENEILLDTESSLQTEKLTDIENVDSKDSNEIENLELEIENEFMGIFTDAFDSVSNDKENIQDTTNLKYESDTVQKIADQMEILDSNMQINNTKLQEDSTQNSMEVGANNNEDISITECYNSNDTTNCTLNYINTNIAKPRVFKTDPELSKIFGKSLKS